MNKKTLCLFLTIAGMLMGSFASAAYCSKNILQTPQGWFVSRVLLTGVDLSIDNTTSGSVNSPTYYDYFSVLAAPTLITGQSYTLSIKSGTGALVSIAAWIDRNGNEVFDTGFDYLGQNDSVSVNSFTNFSFTVPMTGVIGAVRLRIISAMDAPAVLPGGLISPCGAQNDNGEIEDYNLIVAASYAAPSVLQGGTRRIIPIDFCPQGDLSMTQYDGLCAGMSSINGLLSTGTIHPNSTLIDVVMLFPSSTGGINNLASSTGGTKSHQGEDAPSWVDTDICNDVELEGAYMFAHMYGITTMDGCMKTRMDDNLTRAETAKMISNYAKNVLDKKEDTSKRCAFTDTSALGNELAEYAVVSCKLGLMGLDGAGKPLMRFDPNEFITKAQFATILSRLLYGEKYDTDASCWYCRHVTAIKVAKIMTVTTDLFVPLKRGRAMLMLKRIDH